MSVFGSNILAGASGQGGDYNIEDSLRFRSSASADLQRTPSTASNKKTWTWSCWLKLSSLSSQCNLLAAKITGLSYPNTSITIRTTGELRVWSYTGSAGSPSNTFLINKYTTQLFRDPSAWYHIIVALDTTDATAEDRCKIYVNGERVTSFSTNTNPSLNTDLDINDTTAHTIGGSAAGSSGYLDGYLTEVNFIDGQALTADDFGETDTDTGVWKPKEYTGTYGTNGFYLENGRGTDQSGNGNNWTENNFNTSTSSATTYDIMNDVPTLNDEDNANFATLNPLRAQSLSGITVSDGNLTLSANDGYTHGAMALPNTGKFYFEMTAGTIGGTIAIGLADADEAIGSGSLGGANMRAYASNARIYGPTNTNINATYTTGDVIGVACDMDNETLEFYKNNTLQTDNRTDIVSTRTWIPYFASFNGTGGGSINFGQRPFAYTPPTGYKKLNTYNLPDSTVADGSKQFNTVLYTGNGTTGHAIAGVEFQPDLVWIKSRSQVTNHGVHDVLRVIGSAEAILYTNVTNVENTGGAWISSFDSDGFTVNNNTSGNNNGSTYVAWNWKANGSGASNTIGDTNATVSANTTSGFSIVSFNAGAAGNHTVGHGLGVSPNLIIMKDRDSSGYGNWTVFHSDVCTSTSNYLLLNGTGALGSVANSWGSALPTSTVFGFGSNVNIAANDNIIAYCFASTEGFSKFGSYTGNGVVDGPFIYTGFRPAFLLVKRSDGVSDWAVFDTKRDTYNNTQYILYADTTNAEATSNPNLDLLSNGFKWRERLTAGNGTTGTYIYAAFAENPFKNSLAR